MLGLAGPEALAARQIVDEAIGGELDIVWVMGHDLPALFGEEKVRKLAEKTRLFVFSGTNRNATVPYAHWALPTAAYVEKDGTFVNCHGRVQRIGRAFAPLGDSREDWRVLLELAGKLGLKWDWQTPEQIFSALARAVPALDGLSYEAIGERGISVADKLAPGKVPA
jgi:predicted molibdopterin-dependent oxidoreductase YjgC